jgi:hypothetical protein
MAQAWDFVTAWMAGPALRHDSSHHIIIFIIFIIFSAIMYIALSVTTTTGCTHTHTHNFILFVLQASVLRQGAEEMAEFCSLHRRIRQKGQGGSLLSEGISSYDDSDDSDDSGDNYCYKEGARQEVDQEVGR